MDILTTILLFLGSYGNASDECIQVYTFNQDTGTAQYLTGCSGISNPSFIYPSKDGIHLLVACRDSNRIEIYQRNPSTGLLTDTGHNITMSQPTCVQFSR